MSVKTGFVAAITVLLVGMFASVAGAGPDAKWERAVVFKMISPTMFEMNIDGGRPAKVRIIGVASPGIFQMMGASIGKHEGATRGWHERAKQAVASRIAPGAAVTLEYDPFKRTWKGKNDYLLAYVWLTDGRMLNEWIIREGWGEVSASKTDKWKSDYMSMFQASQKQAREAKKGFWAHR